MSWKERKEGNVTIAVFDLEGKVGGQEKEGSKVGELRGRKEGRIVGELRRRKEGRKDGRMDGWKLILVV